MKLVGFLAIVSGLVLPLGVLISQKVESKQAAITGSGDPVIIQETAKISNNRLTTGSQDDLGENLQVLAKDVVKLRAEVMALRTELQVQKQRQFVMSKTAVPARQEAKTVLEMHNNAKVLAEADKQNKEQGEILETGFRHQTENVKWSAQAKNLVQGALSKDKIPLDNVIGVECRSSMCRVELTGDANNQPASIAELPMAVAEEFPNIRANHIKGSDGTVTTILYLSKSEFTPSTQN